MAICTYSVLYHYELGSYGGKKHSFETLHDHVAAANGLPATIGAILASNGRGAPSGYVLVFDLIANAGPSQFLT